MTIIGMTGKRDVIQLLLTHRIRSGWRLLQPTHDSGLQSLDFDVKAIDCAGIIIHTQTRLERVLIRNVTASMIRGPFLLMDPGGQLLYNKQGAR